MFRTLKNGCLTLLTCLGLAAGINEAQAGLMTQQDTNGLVILSTNTFQLYGDRSGSFTNGELPSGNSYIDGSKGDDLWASCGGFFTNTTAGASNVLFGVYQTVNFHDWVLATNVNVVVPASSTNWAHTQFLLQNAQPGYGLRTVANTNGAAVTAAPNTLFFQALSKNGI